MKDSKEIFGSIFIGVVGVLVLSVVIYDRIDQFKNPEFHAPIKLDYDKKQAELQHILDTVTIGLPPFDKRDDHKKTGAQSISIAYHYHKPKTSDIETLLKNIQKITNVELPDHDTSSHSFIRKFCVGENDISVGDYNFDNLYHIRLYVSFYKYDDCRRFVYENGQKK